MAPSRLLGILGAGAAAGVAATAYAAWEARQYTLREVDLPVLPAGMRPLKVLHLSDIHMTPGQTRKQEWLRDLARLELPEAQVAAMQHELNGILKLVDQMRAVDTSGVEPMSHPQAAMQRQRVDHVTEDDQRELFQSIAPQVEDGLYLVPKVVE